MCVQGVIFSVLNCNIFFGEFCCCYCSFRSRVTDMPSKVVKKARPSKMSQNSELAMDNAIKAVKEVGNSARAEFAGM